MAVSTADAPTIRSVTATAVDAPIGRPIRSAVGLIATAPLVLIDVATEDGVEGRAYVFGYTPMTLAPLTAIVTELAECLRGKAVAPQAHTAAFERRFRSLGRDGLLGMALSGLDMALWDALGRAQGLPVVALLGGEPRPLKAYDSYGVIDPVADRTVLERSVERGFRGIKVKLGDGDLNHDVATVAGVRDVIGAEIALMVDYSQALTADEALRRIDALAGYDLAWVEEPVPAEDLAGHAEVRNASPVPVQTGEHWWFAPDMAKALAAGACDYAMPDLMRIGGISGWLAAMELARESEVPLSSHLFQEASAHVLPVTPTAHWLEYLDIAAAVLTEPLPVADGCVTARGPGLGMDWDAVAVAQYRL